MGLISRVSSRTYRMKTRKGTSYKEESSIPETLPKKVKTESKFYQNSKPKPPRKHIKLETKPGKFGKINPIWEDHFANIKQMRRVADAPVDLDGCTKLFDAKDSPKDQRFQILMSLLFSSQTKDQAN